MSDEVVFMASKGKTVLLLVGCVAMVAAGYSMIDEKPVMGWVCVGSFGLGIPVLVMMLTTKSMYLHLDAEGFEMVSPFARKRVKWSDVDGFAMGSIRGAKMIQIVYSPSYSQQKLGRAIASGLSGMEGAIPNSYNAPLDEILKTLNEWRARFGRST